MSKAGRSGRAGGTMPGGATSEERFAFGENWTRFLASVDESRIAEAERSLREMLGVERLDGRSFLDIGCGSGLFSLAARRLGAHVHSFDYDPASSRCAQVLRDHYRPDDPHWRIDVGSVLDDAFVSSLGRFDIVYSWGVLHHTGAMWQAIDAAMSCVAPEGQAFIAIYNDLDGVTRRWGVVKRLYVRSPAPVRTVIVALSAVRLWGLTLLRDTLLGHPLRSLREYKQVRGMSPWRDVVDWVGGYPYEVARAETVIEHVARQGFALQRLITRCGIGCNEFVFRRVSPALRAQLAEAGILPAVEGAS